MEVGECVEVCGVGISVAAELGEGEGDGMTEWKRDDLAEIEEEI
jgi:hypothetical protein